MTLEQEKTINLSVCIMVKDEEEGILTTLESVKQVATDIVILDTGSTDNTVEVITDWCKKNVIQLHLKCEPFVDFSTTRNVLLDFADIISPDSEYQLLLDSRDELRGFEEFYTMLKYFKGVPDSGAFLLHQKWYFGSINDYYNVRLIRPRHNWRYKQVVHEYLDREDGPKDKTKVIDTNVYIYQDRTKDKGKSNKRYIRDKELLLNAHQKNPSESRTVFYLAQTCLCLNDHEATYEWYLKRTKLTGFYEETFHSYMRAANSAVVLNKPWNHCMELYLEAFNSFNMNRAEPLIKIASHYQKIKQWRLAHMFIKEACTLEYPSHHTLFIDSNAYNYQRWHILGVVSYYCDGEEYIKDGIRGAKMAIKNGNNVTLDTSNLNFYELKKNKKN